MHLPLKGEEKLADIVDMLESYFSSEHEVVWLVIFAFYADWGLGNKVCCL